MSSPTLRITEIFYSLQGETSTVGLPTVFIRLTGCPLRCGYCDTTYAFQGGKLMELDEILGQVAQQQACYVTVTGGEPLAQKNCLLLLTWLCDAGYSVSLETSGAIPIDEVDSRVVTIMDWKTPASGEMARNLYENADSLRPHDQVKFVICDRQDYEWAKAKVAEYYLPQRVAEILFSPCAGQLDARDLAQWILEDRLQVRLQMQLHKILWGNEPGR